jgi:hypothetical protein
MKGLTTTIYRKSSELPELGGNNFFHSRKLFEMLEKTPRQKPYMVVATDESGKVVGHLLGILRFRTFIFPPFFLVHCRVLSEGDYAESRFPKGEMLGEMLGALADGLSLRVLYIEVSNLSQKMLGYKQLRQQGFYPVHWMSVHNSLHSHAPEERISEKMMKRIDNLHAKGVTTETVNNEEDFIAFSKLLRKHHILKPKRYIPDDDFFRMIMEDEKDGKLFVTKYHGKVIGCSAVVYSEGNAYLWYSAFKRKTYHLLHPDLMTIWDTMKDASDRGFRHMCFMDVGLPFSKNPFREFILSFGGKEQSTYRWFRFSIRWVNKLLAWIYRE